MVPTALPWTPSLGQESSDCSVVGGGDVEGRLSIHCVSLRLPASSSGAAVEGSTSSPEDEEAS